MNEPFLGNLGGLFYKGYYSWLAEKTIDNGEAAIENANSLLTGRTGEAVDYVGTIEGLSRKELFCFVRVDDVWVRVRAHVIVFIPSAAEQRHIGADFAERAVCAVARLFYAIPLIQRRSYCAAKC